MPQAHDAERARAVDRVALALWKRAYRPLFRRAARQTLGGRLLDPDAPERGRWLEADVADWLARTWARADTLLPVARLEALPTWGNRHNVFLAVLTTAAYQALLDRGVPAARARTLLADVGWKVYAWLLRTASLPFRWTTRDPARRMQRTLRALMVFPFSAPGRPGYETSVWTEGGDTFTHWTHCPPQSFVRRLVREHGDRGELEAFRASWCLYDWPGADLLAGDGRHGHYSRSRTLSHGDPVCDMCWHARARSGHAA